MGKPWENVYNQMPATLRDKNKFVLRLVSITGILRYNVINKKIAMLQKRSMIKIIILALLI